jgi:hypothetical protein
MGAIASHALVHAGLARHDEQDAPQGTVLQQFQAAAQATQQDLWRAPHRVLPWGMRRERGRRSKPRQSLLYEFGEPSRLYPLYSSLMSNHAGQRQNETLMRQE